jgi:ribosomal protein S12 methylthiotransferase
VFTFSPEEETLSYHLPNQLPEEVKQERRNALMEIQQPIAARKNQACVDQTVQVLIEQENPETRELVGRSARFAPEVDGLVYVQGEAALGSMVSVRITDADVYDLYGVVTI